MTKQMVKNYQSVLLSMILLLSFTTFAFAEGGGRYSTEDAWTFGVMADTQWTLSSSTNPTPNPNPQYVAADTAIAMHEEFIDHGVKFVIQCGDLTDRAGDAGMYARDDANQNLYDAGIGFFPLRGNHETYGDLYGRDPNKDLNIPAYLDAFPQTLGLADTYGATNFSSPSSLMPGTEILDGLSYAFDYGPPGNNATFLIVDVEVTHFIVQEAPYNPQSCVDAVTPGTPEGTTPFCGQGYLYFLNSWLYGYNSGFVVYQATYDISNGVTTIYDS
ncbi:MAG: metallophosphoesterase, partial [Deltaproteobacteria bacterium]|nr:metallophosphoesterase [Deltaproteobacteria bacterium]